MGKTIAGGDALLTNQKTKAIQVMKRYSLETQYNKFACEDQVVLVEGAGLLREVV